MDRHTSDAMDASRFQHAIALLESGQAEECLRELEALERVAPGMEEKAVLLLNESRCLLFLGRLAEARQRIDDANRIAPQTQGLLYLHFWDAVLHWQEGKRDVSLRILDRLYEDYRELLLTPEHRELYEQVQSTRGILLGELARYKEARPVLEESLSFDPQTGNRPRVLHNLGLCFKQLGENKLAKEKFLEALRSSSQEPSAPQSHYHLGTIYFADRAYAKAMLEFEACLAGNDRSKMPEENIYGWLASSARAAGLVADAERYEKLAQQASNR